MTTKYRLCLETSQSMDTISNNSRKPFHNFSKWLRPQQRQQGIYFSFAQFFFFSAFEILCDNYENSSDEESFYNFNVLDSQNREVSLDAYKGKVTLVVNVASECGFTDGHYRSLIRLKNVLLHGGKFEILAFPCNQFGLQEPGTNEDIQNFVREVYHVNFPVFGKIDVYGDSAPEAWRYLTSTFGKEPDWNFWKYLVDEDGIVVNAWGPRTPVEDIFHEIKESVDKIGYLKNDYKRYEHISDEL